MMVGRWVSFWDFLFLGAMLNFQGVTCPQKIGRWSFSFLGWSLFTVTCFSFQGGTPNLRSSYFRFYPWLLSWFPFSKRLLSDSHFFTPKKSTNKSQTSEIHSTLCVELLRFTPCILRGIISTVHTCVIQSPSTSILEPRRMVAIRCLEASKLLLYLQMGVSKNSGSSPQIIHFNRVFHYFHHPFWGTTILEQPNGVNPEHPFHWGRDGIQTAPQSVPTLLDSSCEWINFSLP